MSLYDYYRAGYIRTGDSEELRHMLAQVTDISDIVADDIGALIESRPHKPARHFRIFTLTRVVGAIFTLSVCALFGGMLVAAAGSYAGYPLIGFGGMFTIASGLTLIGILET